MNAMQLPNARASVGFLVYMVAIPFYWSNFSFLILALFAALPNPSKFESETIASSRINLLLILFVASFGLSILFSDSLESSLRFSAAWPSCLLLYYLIATKFDINKDWTMLCLAFSLSALFAGALCIAFFISAPDSSPSMMISTIRSPLFVVPNDTIFLSLATPFSFSLISKARNRAVLLTAFASIAVSLIAVLIAESRTALGIIFICGVIYCWGKKAGLTLLALVSLAVIADLILGASLLQKIPVIPSSRLPLWDSALALFREHPLFGGGPFTFGDYYQEFIKTVRYPAWVVVDTRTIPWPHNLYLELLSGSGLLCLLAFLGVVLATFYRLIAESIHGKIDGSVLRTVIAALVGFLIAALVETSFLRLWTLVLFFTLVGVVSNIEINESRHENKQSGFS